MTRQGRTYNESFLSSSCDITVEVSTSSKVFYYFLLTVQYEFSYMHEGLQALNHAHGTDSF